MSVKGFVQSTNVEKLQKRGVSRHLSIECGTYLVGPALNFWKPKANFSRGAKRWMWIPSQNQWIGITWQRREHIFPYYDGALIAAFDLQCIVLVIKIFFFWFITTATKCKNSVQDSNSFYFWFNVLSIC
jgi:hypothetical protein